MAGITESTVQEVIDLHNSGKTFKQIKIATGVGRKKAKTLLVERIGYQPVRRRPRENADMVKLQFLRAAGNSGYSIAKQLGLSSSYVYRRFRELDYLKSLPASHDAWDSEIEAYHNGKTREEIAASMNTSIHEVGLIFRFRQVDPAQHLAHWHKNKPPRYTLPIEEIHYLREMGNSWTTIARLTKSSVTGVRLARGRLKEQLDKLPVVAVDFDGVIHSYENGWCGGKITGRVVAGFFEWLLQCYNKLHIVIYSCRNATRIHMRAMARWIRAEWKTWSSVEGNNPQNVPLCVSYSDSKPIAVRYIDDRGFHFTGNWQDENLRPQALAQFKTWNEQ